MLCIELVQNSQELASFLPPYSAHTTFFMIHIIHSGQNLEQTDLEWNQMTIDGSDRKTSKLIRPCKSNLLKSLLITCNL